MLTVQQLSKSFSTQLLFHNLSFTLNRGDRLGLVGVNGSGKSTLLRILAGREAADSGQVILSPPTIEIGYLPQGFEPPPSQTIAGILAQQIGDPKSLELKLTQIGEALAAQPDDERLTAAYDKTLTELAGIDSGRIASTLAEVGLSEIDLDSPCRKLSGGQKTRLGLALVMLKKPQLLLLDEPTNHLDIEMLAWLEDWLASFAGGAMIVSHDRAFLDKTVNHILALDPRSQTGREYAGNYSVYLAMAISEREKTWAAYTDQQSEIRRIQQDITRTSQRAESKEKATIDSKQRRYSKKVAKLAKSRQKKLERYLDSDDILERPKRNWQLNIEWSAEGLLSQKVLETVDLSIGYGHDRPLLTGLNLTVFVRSRIAIVGENGTGKTTLLKTIAGLLPPLKGFVQPGHSVKMGTLWQEQENLDLDLTAVEMMRQKAAFNEKDARNYLHHFLFSGDDPVRPARELSYGQRVRLALALLVAQGSSFLLLDEPLNHLDIPSRTQFEAALADFKGALLVVTHDRYFIDRFADEVWIVEAGELRRELRRSNVD